MPSSHHNLSNRIAKKKIPYMEKCLKKIASIYIMLTVFTTTIKLCGIVKFKKKIETKKKSPKKIISTIK